MNFDSLSIWIGKKTGLRKLAFFFIRVTTLRQWYIDRLLTQILKHQKTPFCFLDLGCGLGQYSFKIAKKHPDADIVAIDIDQQQIENCTHFARQEHLTNIRFFSKYIEELDEGLRCDVILCNSVLEHIKADQEVLSEFFNRLNQNGYLIVYVPVAEHRLLPNLARQQQHILYRTKKAFLHEHVRYYTKDELLAKLEQAGFAIEKCAYTYGVYGKLSYDIVTTVQYSPFFKLLFPFYLFLLHPYVLLLMWADYKSRIKRGNGFYVIARKRS